MDNKKLQRWAMIAEVLGGIAIFITLIFLVLETRSNTNAIQAQTYQSLTAELNKIRFESTSTEHAGIYLKYGATGFEELNDLEKFILVSHAEATWGLYESAYYAEDRGVLGPNEWLRFENAICRNYKTDYLMWESGEDSGMVIDGTAITSISNNVTPVFSEYVRTKCR